jgi:hypothetical protein
MSLDSLSECPCQSHVPGLVSINYITKGSIGLITNKAFQQPMPPSNLAPRLSDAVSLTTGMTVFHFDGLNDSKSKHDNISLRMKSIKNWSEYCSKTSLQKLQSNDGLRIRTQPSPPWPTKGQSMVA